MALIPPEIIPWCLGISSNYSMFLGIATWCCPTPLLTTLFWGSRGGKWCWDRGIITTYPPLETGLVLILKIRQNSLIWLQTSSVPRS